MREGGDSVKFGTSQLQSTPQSQFKHHEESSLNDHTVKQSNGRLNHIIGRESDSINALKCDHLLSS